MKASSQDDEIQVMVKGAILRCLAKHVSAQHASRLIHPRKGCGVKAHCGKRQRLGSARAPACCADLAEASHSDGSKVDKRAPLDAQMARRVFLGKEQCPIMRGHGTQRTPSAVQIPQGMTVHGCPRSGSGQQGKRR